MKSPIRQPLTTLISLLAVAALAGCSKSEKPDASAATPQPNVNSKQPSPASPAAKTEAFAGLDACKSLTREEIQAVQGEPFIDSRGSGKTGGGLSVSQCYFNCRRP